MDFMLHNGLDGLSKGGWCRQDKQLNTFDWLADIPGNQMESEFVEVQFKNTRKGYYRNTYQIPLQKGDIVAVESSPGHDIGEVTLTGRLVPLQMKKANIRSEADIKRIYRRAKQVDMEKYEEAKAREHDTMIRARQIALDLNLQMKIGDVEYQGDGNKAIFYYIADERVDFRQLIKVLADAFHVRIEMKQIGARQEAGRIGGIGPCGRELCCATWMTSFVSVSTNAARLQDISLNPQKLAGQCAKLKCCLNYEIDSYVESQRKLPSREITLETKDGLYYFFKADILSNQITYSTDKGFPANAVTISSRRAFEVLGMNRKGIKPDTLEAEGDAQMQKGPQDLLEQESLTRFDKSGKNKEGRNKKKKQERGGKIRKEAQDNGQEGRKENRGPREGGRPQKEARDGEGRAQNTQPRPSNPQNGQNPRREDNGQRQDRKPKEKKWDKGPRKDDAPRRPHKDNPNPHGAQRKDGQNQGKPQNQDSRKDSPVKEQ